MSLQLILGAVFGGGFASLLATVFRLIEERRRGKLISEDSVITRLEKENRAARARADQAEEETARYRRRMMEREDEAAHYRRILIERGIAVPPEGPDHAAR